MSATLYAWQPSIVMRATASDPRVERAVSLAQAWLERDGSQSVAQEVERALGIDLDAEALRRVEVVVHGLGVRLLDQVARGL